MPALWGAAWTAVFVFLAGATLSETRVETGHYICAGGVHLPVSFITPSGEAGYAVLLVEGKLSTLRAAPSGSGVRYISLDEQDSYRLYTKGANATVRHLAADHTATEVTVLDGCRFRD